MLFPFGAKNSIQIMTDQEGERDSGGGGELSGKMVCRPRRSLPEVIPS